MEVSATRFIKGDNPKIYYFRVSSYITHLYIPLSILQLLFEIIHFKLQRLVILSGFKQQSGKIL